MCAIKSPAAYRYLPTVGVPREAIRARDGARAGAVEVDTVRDRRGAFSIEGYRDVRVAELRLIPYAKLLVGRRERRPCAPCDRHCYTPRPWLRLIIATNLAMTSTSSLLPGLILTPLKLYCVTDCMPAWPCAATTGA